MVGPFIRKNFVHVLLNNGVHDSVGGQPTVGLKIDFCEIARSSGYKIVHNIKSEKDIKKIIENINGKEGPYFIEIQVKPGNRKDIGRPTKTPTENKKSIMDYIENTKKNL